MHGPTVPMVTASAALATGESEDRAPTSSDPFHFQPMIHAHDVLLYELAPLREIMSRNLAAGRLPDTRMVADIAERRRKGVDAVGHAGEIGMQRDRHHASRFRALAIEHVELPTDHVA